MLTELKISNFRVFDDEVTVRFRPITVLIGRNNAGKSSIIKFLLMLQQSLGLGKPQFLTPEGDRVQLGIFSELRNSRTKKKRGLRFSLTTEQPYATPSNILLHYIEKGEFKGVDMSNVNLVSKVEADVLYSRDSQAGSTQYSLTDVLSGITIIKRSMKISDDSAFLGVAEELYREFKSAASESKATSAKATRKNPKQSLKSLEAFSKMGDRLVAEHDFLDSLRYEIRSISHLLPIREESQRVILTAPPPVGEVGQRGQYAIPHLQRLVSANKADYKFIQPHLENVAGISDIQFEESSDYMSRCLAKNTVTGAEVLIANYGFGVSQCLPIFVQGAIVPPNTTLMVEQPEEHLHPTAQLEIGSFFSDLWQKRKVGSIIETHSDNMLLRLRRLIATGKLPAKDVSVAYFAHDENNGNMPVIRNLDINPDGSMESGLPAEFFGKNLEEILEMGVGPPQDS